TLKGFAKFASARDAARRRILQDYKYPDTAEPKAMRLYYREARDLIEAYHRGRHEPGWMLARSEELTNLGGHLSGNAKTRLRANARALRAYSEEFGTRKFEPRPGLRLAYEVGDVGIKVTPDLH